MKDLLLTAIVFGLLARSLTAPRFGIYAWYWMGLMNPHRLCYGFAYSFPYSQLIAIATLVGFVVSKEKKSIPWNYGLVIVLTLLIYTAITSAYGWRPEAAWGYWVQFIKVLLLTFVATMVIYGRERIHTLLLVITLSIGFYGIKGGAFAILSAGQYKVWGPPGATFISGNTFIGLAMDMVIPILIALARQESRKWLRNSLYATAGLTVVASIFTYSRGAWLGLGVVASLMVLKSNKKFLLVIALIPIAFVAKDLLPEKLFKRADTIESYEQDESAMQRIRSWQVSYRIAKDRPLLGAGFEYLGSDTGARWASYMDEKYRHFGKKVHVSHSYFFQMMVMHGFLALGLFISLIVSTLRKLWKLSHTVGDNSEMSWIAAYAGAMFTGLMGFVVSGLFLDVAFFDLFYIFVALTAILEREYDSFQPGKDEEPRVNKPHDMRQRAIQASR